MIFRHEEDDRFFATGYFAAYHVVGNSFIEESDMVIATSPNDMNIDIMWTMVADPNREERYATFTFLIGKDVKEKLMWIDVNKIAYWNEIDGHSFISFNEGIDKIAAWSLKIDKLKVFK